MWVRWSNEIQTNADDTTALSSLNSRPDAVVVGFFCQRAGPVETVINGRLIARYKSIIER